MKINMENKEILHEIKKNLSSKYLLPTLQIANREFTAKILKELGFVNAYLEDVDKPLQTPNCIILVFSFPKSYEEKFESIVNVLEKEVVNYVSNYKIDDCVYGIIFKVLPEWVYIIDLFKKGKYSEFGENYAKEFKIESSKNRSLVLEQYKVITRDPSYLLQKAEDLGIKPSVLDHLDLDDHPDVNDYIFNYNKIKENANKQ